LAFFLLDSYIPMDYIESMKPKELKEWRRKNGYSQSQLATALGVIVLTVSRWERGARKIPAFLPLALKSLEKEGGSKHGERNL